MIQSPESRLARLLATLAVAAGLVLYAAGADPAAIVASALALAGAYRVGTSALAGFRRNPHA